MGIQRATVVEFMKPIVLIAGIPMALSAAGFICARTISRNNLSSKAATSVTQTEGSISKASTSEIQAGSIETSPAPAEEFRDEESFHCLHSTPYTNSSEYKEIVCIKSDVRKRQEREGELEKQFLRYSDLKKHEASLAKFQNTLMSEMVRTEFLGREVSSLQAQTQMIENLGMEFLRVVEQHRLTIIKSGLLRMRVKKLSKKIKSKSQIMKKQKLCIKAKDMEILTEREELKSGRNIIKALEEERSELRGIINRLETEKAQLLNMQDTAETSTSSIAKDQAKGEEYNQLVNELEKVRKEQAAELKELSYLRWNNACLRHELTRNQEGNQEQKSPSEQEVEGNTEIEGKDDETESKPDKSILTGSSLGIEQSSSECSNRPKLLQKLRSRWAGGRRKVKGKSEDNGKMEEAIHLGRQYVSDVIDQHCHARWSCSSV